VSAPTVIAVDPGSGPAGTQVVITGSGFTEDTRAVAFGGVSAGTRFAVVSSTQILAYVPEGAGTVHVTVTTPGGASATSSADQFTIDPYVGPPGGGGGGAPTVTSVLPGSATDNDGGDVVAVHGTGFTTAIAVRFGIAAASPQGVFTVMSDAELSVLTPPGSGTVDVIVTNSYGESAPSPVDEFSYPELPPPTVSALSPSGGYYGSKVTITGAGFDEATSVYFGDEPATFIAALDTTITCYAPEGSGAVHVTVTGPGGTSAETSADVFNYGRGGLPRTTASPNVAPSGYDGWAQGDQTVTLYPDAASGYGIAHTYYAVDVGGLTEYAGPFVVAGGGCHLVQYWSVDVRGNQEPMNVGYVNILSASQVPSGLSVTPLFNAVVAKWDAVVNLTPTSYRLYRGTTPDTVTGLVAATSANVVTIAQPATDGARFYAVSSVDTGGNESAKCLVVGPVTAEAVVVPDGSVSITKFASGIVPPRVVGALPSLPDAAFPAGSVVFLTTDGRLYRTTTGGAGTWGNVVNASDLTGTITAGQLGAGSVTGDALASGVVDATKLDPSIKTLQTIDALPELPDPLYPAGTAVFIPDEGRIYRVQEAADLVPIMTSNTAPSGVAAASSEYDPGYAAWRAFSDVPGDRWATAGSDPAPWWIEYQFGSARVITWYSFMPGAGEPIGETPKTWTFEGFNGSAWDVLDTQANVTDWAADTPKDFDVLDNETAYERYRLHVSANVGSAYCALSALQMAGWMPTQDTTLVVNADVDPFAAIEESKLDLAYPTHSNANDPSANEKAALAGTSGAAPTGANKLVDNADPRLANARTPTAHKTTHATGNGDAIAPADIGAATSGHTHDYAGATITNKPTLGTAAAKNVPASGNAAAAEVVQGNDTRLTDARAPQAHSHAPADVTGTAVVTADARLSDARTPLAHDNAKHSTAYAADSALTAHTGATTGAHGGIVASSDGRLTDARTPTAHDNAKHTVGVTAGASAPGDVAAEGASAAVARADHKHGREAFGTAAGTVCQGNDSRLADARTPTTHDNARHAAAYALDSALTTHGALGTSAHGGIVASSDGRLTDQRVPTDLSVTNVKVAANAAIAESKLALNNPTHPRQHDPASTADHSFPGGTAQFLRSDGAWGVPPGTGGEVIPTGTGLVHITGGVKDAASKLVENADVAGSAAIAYSKLNLADSIDLDDLVAALQEKLIPSGLIAQWEGSVAPAGWVLCDNSAEAIAAGAPDLRDKFIIGAGGAHASGATGGSATQPDHGALSHTGAGVSAHTGGNVSSHTGGGVSADGGAHDHGTLTGHAGGHDHGGVTGDRGTQNTKPQGSSTTFNFCQTHNHPITAVGTHQHSITGAGNHGHGFTQPSNHTFTQPSNHTVTQPDAHAAQGHGTNLPPYYALAYIMKL
jgi:hypothetical protein